MSLHQVQALGVNSLLSSNRSITSNQSHKLLTFTLYSHQEFVPNANISTPAFNIYSSIRKFMTFKT